MQKGRILLSLFSFPFISVLLLSLLIQSYLYPKEATQKKVLAASIQSLEVNTSPTITPEPSPTSTSTPTQTPAVQKPQPTEKTIATSLPTSTTDYVLSKVNEYRTSLGLFQVSSNKETCEFARIRAEEISSAEKFNHDGFTNRVNSHSLPYPGYHEVTENIAYNTDYTDVVDRWIASPGHAENMRKNTQHVCIGKFGDYYTMEGWQP